MAALHDALQCMNPVSWDKVPQSPDELREYVRDIFKKSRLVAESLPDPPTYAPEEHHAHESHSTPRVVPSSARVGDTDSEILSVQKQWGKPIKMGGPKDNPLGLHVWKLNSNDGGGHWFGRRSVHEGLGFSQWRRKLSMEYDETLKGNLEKIEEGKVPDVCIRGIGAEQKVEAVEVKDEDGSIIAEVMVYHVSAQFPKPTAPRDFVPLIITSDHALQIGGTKQPGRSWMMISKPCNHDQVKPKYGYVRGEYESIELIREIPRKNIDGSSSKTSLAPADEKADMDEELNPVEWIMVTRSDPGGNIPRWLVDKGTPSSVGADAAKFVNWAVQKDKRKKQAPANPETSEGAGLVPNESGNELDDDEEDTSDSDLDSVDSDTSHHGLIASVTGLLNTGIERYTPQAILDYIPIPHHRSASQSFSVDRSLNTTSPEANTDGVKALHSETNDAEHPSETMSLPPHESDRVSLSSAPHSDTCTSLVDGVVQNTISQPDLIEMSKSGKLTSQEKELAKLALRKREIDAKLDTVRASMESFHIPPQPVSATPEKDIDDIQNNQSGILKNAAETRSSTPGSSSGTQKSRHSSHHSVSSGPPTQARTNASPSELPGQQNKVASQLRHEEAKLLKQLRKTEASQLKVALKIQAKQRKVVGKEEKSKSKSEVELLRGEVKDLKSQVAQLRAERQKYVDIVASLQSENTKLVAMAEKH
ncbi:hypothetical protein N7495_005855 [Penicillium taxi]|uniref:uncharacterized protein n=1 Tax=Penicillium taxi TaxID=168475 RepID=UPI002544E3A6|nr:uncharacterized protein N7495_005855 [Penicillium taxi]KAJ5894164.1 hypothetical protein N7495_005855 [Penicillium taxi]